MSLQRSCRLLGRSRQGIYQHIARRKVQEEQQEPVVQWVLNIRRLMPRLGGRKLYYLLHQRMETEGIKLGRDGFFTLLRQRRLLVPPRRSYIKTTYSKHWMRKHANLLKELTVTRVEQVFVADITYVESGEGVHYLALVTDAYSRKIMGWHLSLEMKASDTVQALQMAIKNRVTTQALIHHSDRGLQYCSKLYQDTLGEAKIEPSMTDGYDCYQNALAERINGILKMEYLLYKPSSFTELDCMIRQSVRIYNELRPHTSLNLQTPESVHRKASSEEPAGQ